MTIWGFLKDRLVMILIYFLSNTLVVLVVQLDVLQQGTSIHKDNIYYIYILSFGLLILYLIGTYIRQFTFFREINRINRTTGLGRVAGLQSAVTKEQQAIQELFLSTYKDYMLSLSRLQELQDRHQDFINQWVHNMKTPVSVINLLIQQSRGLDGDEEVHQLLQSLEEEIERITQGLDMVLHAARLERIEVDTYIKRIDLVSLVREAINDFKKMMIRSAIFPKLSCDTEPIWVETDPKWLTFILKQLISNAIKYTPKGRNKMIVFEIKEDHTGVTFSLRDEGIGIPKEDLLRVFDPFFTGENGRKGADSTGMGLYFAKEASVRLGHQLFVESETGKGTNVSLVFFNESIHRALLSE